MGDGARKTNHDYTHGQLDELIEVVILHSVKLFVSAIGVPPECVIKPKRHPDYEYGRITEVCRQGIQIRRGYCLHTQKIFLSQFPSLLLWMLQKTIGALSLGSRRWSLPSGESMVGEVWLVLGTSGVWVEIQFVASESAASKINIEAVISARFGDTVTGRLLHVLSNDYIGE